MFEQFGTSETVLPERDFPALAEAIAALPPAQPGGSALAAAAELRALTILHRRLTGVVLDRLASFDAQGFAVASGSGSTAAWVRAYTNVTGPAASSLVAAARTSRTLPALAAELNAGRIGVEHLQAVARSTQQVPDDVLAQHDATLRDLAPHVTPAHLHRAGAKITEAWDAGAAADNVNHAEETRRLSISQTLHGVWALDGSLTPEAGAKLAAALQPLMRRRGPEDTRNAAQRRADALLDLVEIALRSGDLPDCGGDRTRITLVVHATESALDLLEHHRIPDDDVPVDHADGPADAADDQAHDECEGPEAEAERVSADEYDLPENHSDCDARLSDSTPVGVGAEVSGLLLSEGPDQHWTEDGDNGSMAGTSLLVDGDPFGTAGATDNSPLVPPAARSRPGPPTKSGRLVIPRDATGSAPPGGVRNGPPDGVRSSPGAWLAGGRLAAVFGDGSSHRQLLGSHAELTIEALTRLGCDADLALAIMDVTGQPIYLSRTSRDPNTAQRRLLLIRDGGCVFPGCDRPPPHCQAHHLKFWTRDHGPTDIDNLALVCGFHHWLIHDKHWTLRATPPGPDAPAGGWLAESPDGLTLTGYRRLVA